MIEQLLNDLRYGAKMLWKIKSVTIVAVVSLAVGIGANSAIFSIVNSIILRPRPVAGRSDGRIAVRINQPRISQIYTEGENTCYRHSGRTCVMAQECF